MRLYESFQFNDELELFAFVISLRWTHYTTINFFGMKHMPNIKQSTIVAVCKYRRDEKERQRAREPEKKIWFSSSIFPLCIVCLIVFVRANVNEWRNYVDFSIRSAVRSFSINRLKWLGSVLQSMFYVYIIFLYIVCPFRLSHLHFTVNVHRLCVP